MWVCLLPLLKANNNPTMIEKDLNYGRQVLDRLAAEIKASVVLDLGGGHGADLETVRKHHPTAALHAVESNVHYASFLRDRGITVHNLNLENSALPFGDNTTDLIIANQILEHTKEIFWIFHEATRVLKTGGYFYIGVPNLASMHNRLLLLAGRHPTSIRSSSAHVRGFTRSDLVRFLSACWPGGYTVQKFAGSNFYPLPKFLAIPAARLFPNAAVSIFLLLRKERAYVDAFIKYPEDLETNFFLGRDVHHVVVSNRPMAKPNLSTEQNHPEPNV